jgi:hypothetical protein
MGYLVAFHWAWLAAAAVMGLAMGWIAVVQRATGLTKRAMQVAAAMLIVAIGAAASRFVPGRPGYWLDLGLVMLGVYLAGCALGSWLRERLIWRSTPPT